MWSRKFERCVNCSRTKFRHMARGLCSSCYAKRYKQNPKHKARIDSQKVEWYWRYHEENLLKRKIAREQKHFGGKREAVLGRDNYRCVRCQAVEQLTVHHIDRKGRGALVPNNRLSNLITLCRSCHAKEHSDEIQTARRKYKI